MSRIRWDAVVIDESHNLINPGSRRRAFAEALVPRTDALLLAGAAPHNGDKRSFADLISLLDPAAMAGVPRPGHPLQRPRMAVTGLGADGTGSGTGTPEVRPMADALHDAKAGPRPARTGGPGDPDRLQALVPAAVAAARAHLDAGRAAWREAISEPLATYRDHVAHRDHVAQWRTDSLLPGVPRRRDGAAPPAPGHPAAQRDPAPEEGVPRASPGGCTAPFYKAEREKEMRDAHAHFSVRLRKANDTAPCRTDPARAGA
nr:hypothetical protein [Streptomyces sp. NRRL F-5135]